MAFTPDAVAEAIVVAMKSALAPVQASMTELRDKVAHMESRAVPSDLEIATEDLVAVFSGLLTKEVAALGGVKRVVRDAKGKVDHVVEEPV